MQLAFRIVFYLCIAFLLVVLIGALFGFVHIYVPHSDPVVHYRGPEAIR